jgi:hypothetical protein
VTLVTFIDHAHWRGIVTILSALHLLWALPKHECMNCHIVDRCTVIIIINMMKFQKFPCIPPLAPTPAPKFIQALSVVIYH